MACLGHVQRDDGDGCVAGAAGGCGCGGCGGCVRSTPADYEDRCAFFGLPSECPAHSFRTESMVRPRCLDVN